MNTEIGPEPWWMLRKADMRIFRPVPQDEMIAQIEAGEIAPNDELCAAGGYWFMLSEVNEVRKHFGDIDLTCLRLGTAESTSSTDTYPHQKTVIIQNPSAPQSGSSSMPTAAQNLDRPKARLSMSFRDVTDPRLTLRGKRRVKNAIGVGVGFVIFIVVLVYFWSGSY